jgi:hypothetical protein
LTQGSVKGLFSLKNVMADIQMFENIKTIGGSRNMLYTKLICYQF